MSQENGPRRPARELGQQSKEDLGPQERYEYSVKLVAEASNDLAKAWQCILQDGLNPDTLQASANAREAYLGNAAELFHTFLNVLRVTDTTVQHAEEKALLMKELVTMTNQRTAAETKALAYKPTESMPRKIGQLLGLGKPDSQPRHIETISIKYPEDLIEEGYRDILAEIDSGKQPPDMPPLTDRNEPLVTAGVAITGRLLAQEHATLDHAYGKRLGATSPSATN